MEKKPLTKHPETRGGINEKIIKFSNQKENLQIHQLRKSKEKI